MKGRYTLIAASVIGWAIVSACGSDDGNGPTDPPPVVPGGPTATITAPDAGSAFTTGQRVAFRGMATDDEDGVLGDAALSWSSNRDGTIGTGTSLDYNGLTTGAHTITLTATDSDGLKGYASVTVTIGEVPVLPPVPPGAVILQDDMDDENGGVAMKNYTGFENWNVTRPCVDLHGPGSIDPVPGNGLYIDMDGSYLEGSNCTSAGRMETKEQFALAAGNYKLELVVAGNNQNGATDSMDIMVGSEFSTTLVVTEEQSFTIREFTFNVAAATTARIILDHAGSDEQGMLVDAIRLSRN